MRTFDRTLIKGRVPKNIINLTRECYEEYMSLYDSFDYACRELAPKGTELYNAWYYGDFRKYIPSEYLEEYLNFEKYPMKY